MLKEPLLAVMEQLAAAEARWAIIGGLAVSARSEPRFTRDANIVVDVASDAEAEAVVHELVTSGAVVTLMVEQEAVGRLAAVHLELPALGDEAALVDLMFAHSGIEAEIVAEADVIELMSGLDAPVARTGHLLALKLLAVSEERPQDVADIKALLAVADEAEMARARESLGLIEERGYNRERDLAALFEEYVARFSSRKGR